MKEKYNIFGKENIFKLLLSQCLYLFLILLVINSSHCNCNDLPFWQKYINFDNISYALSVTFNFWLFHFLMYYAIKYKGKKEK